MATTQTSRDGLSRKAYGMLKKAKAETENPSVLLDELFGTSTKADHFSKTPLDGGAVVEWSPGALPEAPKAPTPAQREVRAGGPGTAVDSKQADWFSTGHREMTGLPTPGAAKAKPSRPNPVTLLGAVSDLAGAVAAANLTSTRDGAPSDIPVPPAMGSL